MPADRGPIEAGRLLLRKEHGESEGVGEADVPQLTGSRDRPHDIAPSTAR